MGELLDSVEDMKPLRRGDVVEGIVMRADPGAEGLLLNVGHKAEGHVPSNEMKSMSEEDLAQLSVGDTVLAMVIRGETDEGSAILSIDRAAGEVGWKTLQDAMDADERVSGKIIGFNRGGAIVMTESVQGFVPMSQLATVSRDKARVAAQGSGEGAPEESPDIGRTIELKVLELNRGRNRAILSERQAMQELREERKAKLIDELTEGEVRRGRVTGISHIRRVRRSGRRGRSDPHLRTLLEQRQLARGHRERRQRGRRHGAAGRCGTEEDCVEP